jgi:hypothetical protein
MCCDHPRTALRNAVLVILSLVMVEPVLCRVDVSVLSKTASEDAGNSLLAFGNQVKKSTVYY